MKKRIFSGLVLTSVLIAIVLMLLMVPTASGEKPQEQDCWDKSSLVGDCITIDDAGVLTARVCNTGDKEMLGTTTWELYWVASGNPKNATTPIASGKVPALVGGGCTDIFDTSLNPNPEGNYGFRVLQRPCHPGQGELWITEICPTPSVPEVHTIVLMSIGLIMLGGFVWFSRHKATVTA